MLPQFISDGTGRGKWKPGISRAANKGAKTKGRHQAEELEGSEPLISVAAFLSPSTRDQLRTARLICKVCALHSRLSRRAPDAEIQEPHGRLRLYALHVFGTVQMLPY
jgi:hypothetical protein